MAQFSSNDFMEMESTYGAHNYHPLPVVISKAEGIWVEDPEGKRYIDMLSAYSAVNAPSSWVRRVIRFVMSIVVKRSLIRHSLVQAVPCQLVSSLPVCPSQMRPLVRPVVVSDRDNPDESMRQSSGP